MSKSANYVEVTITSRLADESTLKHCTVVLSLNDTDVRDGGDWRQLMGEVIEETCYNARRLNAFTIYDAKGKSMLAILPLPLHEWLWSYTLLLLFFFSFHYGYCCCSRCFYTNLFINYSNRRYSSSLLRWLTSNANNTNWFSSVYSCTLCFLFTFFFLSVFVYLYLLKLLTAFAEIETSANSWSIMWDGIVCAAVRSFHTLWHSS